MNDHSQKQASALVVGAGGFIGRRIVAALTSAGWRVRHGVSARRYAALPAAARETAFALDYARDTVDTWSQRLRAQPVEVVINAVGVLRTSRTRPIEAVHHSGPIALFDACTQPHSGVRRIIQISALGVEGSSTRYANTKRAADVHLLALAAQGRCNATVLRPSIVFGCGGASTSLFMNLARLPLLCLPGPVLTAQVQPVAVADLAAAVLAWAQEPSEASGIMECTGPEALSLADLIASLRQQCGHAPARVLRLPDSLSRLSARMGDWLPFSPWCSETLAMLGTDNVGNAALLRDLLGRETVHYRQLVATL